MHHILLVGGRDDTDSADEGQDGDKSILILLFWSCFEAFFSDFSIPALVVSIILSLSESEPSAFLTSALA